MEGLAGNSCYLDGAFPLPLNYQGSQVLSIVTHHMAVR